MARRRQCPLPAHRPSTRHAEFGERFFDVVPSTPFPAEVETIWAPIAEAAGWSTTAEMAATYGTAPAPP